MKPGAVRYVYALGRNILRWKRADQELDEELRAYLELIAAQKIRNGVDAGDALREAHREIGGLEQVKENVRDIRIGASMETLAQDIRYAIRGIRKNLAFSAVVILTLALGIGANTAIFSLVNGVILKPLPYPNAGRLLMLWETQLSDGSLGTVAPANFFDWRERSRSFDRMAAVDPYPDFILSGADGPRRLEGAAVSSDFFSLFGVRMALGRDFLPQEDSPGRNQVVILGHSAWRRYFAARPDIIGKLVTLNSTGYTVIGVLPRDFSLVSKAADFQARNRFDLWTPLALPSPPQPWQRGTHPLCVFARLKPGVPLRQAQADLNRTAADLERLYPADDREKGIAAVPLAEHVVANVRMALFTLLAAVGILLLIACANIANLALTRALGRRKEIALRVALGASRKRIAQQLLTESILLALFGGLLGFACAWFGVPALVAYLPADLPRTAEIAVDARVFAFTSMASLVTGIVFGLIPLLQFRQANAHDALKHSGRGVAGAHSRLRDVLVVAQVAMALVLLTGAGLMAKSLWKLLRVSPGFQTEHILTARLSLPPHYTGQSSFGTGAHRPISTFQRDVLAQARTIPGVQSAAFAAYLPLSGSDNSWSFDIEGRPPKAPGVFDITAYRPVTAEYFETIGIPILRGRGFEARDNEDGGLVVAVSESMARAFWRGQNPVGQRLRFGDANWRTVVGVVGDVRHEGLGAMPAPAMYVPYGQIPNVEAHPTLVLRTSVEPGSVARALRMAVSAVDSNVPVDSIDTMRTIVSGSVSQSRFRTAVLVVFAFFALFVASIGLYGVMSYLVGQRIREFGIRMAIGASRGAVLRLVLGQAVKLAAIGIGLGLVAAAVVTRWIASLLYGVTPGDAGILLSVSILLSLVALAASYIPARRAAKADPMISLRYE